MSPPFAIAAGGTGGHMFPAQALAAELAQRGHRSVVICDARGARFLQRDQEHRLIAAASPTGSPLQRLQGLASLACGFAQSLSLLRRLRPAALAAFGGYASVPVALAAAALRIPILAHEQNAVLGRANRMVARRAQRLALTFEATRGAEEVPAERRLIAGNPVREAVAPLAGRPYATPAAAEPLRLLVVGGSQGARVLSDVVPAAIALLAPEKRARLDLTQQCRPEDLPRVGEAYAAIGFAAELAPFFEDLPERLAEAHLVISRAGASSVAELLVLGRPSILVPFRLAADDHQSANALAVAAAGAAWTMPEAELTPERLAGRLAAVLTDPGMLAPMAAAARGQGRPDAAAALADALLALCLPAPATLRREATA
jgi:UDP-N-acetylglucosamine--N-acetylmuramyl-(pentapeptide) pyrophosphoryl-undecaprenol N-acetylglucosamine transferase